MTITWLMSESGTSDAGTNGHRVPRPRPPAPPLRLNNIRDLVARRDTPLA